MENKKGIFPLAAVLPIIIGIIAIVLVFSFLASTKIRFIIIGSTIVVLTIMYVVPAVVSGNVTKAKVAIITVLIGVGVIIIFSSSVLQTTFGGFEYINVPTIGFYECLPASIPVMSTETNVGASEINVKCPSNTDKCDIIFKSVEDVGFLALERYLVYTRNGVETKTRVNDDLRSVTIFNVAKNEIVKLRYVKVLKPFSETSIAGSVYSARYNPFILWNQPGLGGKFEYSSIEQGCNFRNSEFQDLIISNTLNIPLGTSSSNNVLEPYKTRNYLDVIVPVSVESRRFQTLNSEQVYCSNKNIYKIDTILTGSNTYKIVNYNKRLSSVDCCTGDFEPGRQCINNKWKDLPKPSEPITQSNSVECSAVKQCPGFEFSPFDGDTLVKYVCKNSLCVPESKEVECTTNNQCSGETPVCDTLLYECVSAPAPTQVASTLTQSECLQKSKDNILAGWSYVETVTKPSIVEEIATLGFAKDKVVGQCKATFLPYYLIGGMVIVLGSVVTWMLVPRRRKK